MGRGRPKKIKFSVAKDTSCPKIVKKGSLPIGVQQVMAIGSIDTTGYQRVKISGQFLQQAMDILGVTDWAEEGVIIKVREGFPIFISRPDHNGMEPEVGIIIAPRV